MKEGKGKHKKKKGKKEGCREKEERKEIDDRHFKFSSKV